jgi:hypothetical protein
MDLLQNVIQPSSYFIHIFETQSQCVFYTYNTNQIIEIVGLIEWSAVHN